MNRLLLATAAVLALTTSAHAGPYVSIAGGVSQQHFSEAEGAGLHRLHYRAGPIGHLAVGYAWASGWRAEVEGGASSNSPESFKLHHRPDTYNIGGDVTVYRLMVNGAYDFGRAQSWPVQPYLEAGLGAAVADIHTGLPGCQCPGAMQRWEANGSGTTNVVLAGQLGGGLNIPVSERLTLFVGVRYFRALMTPELNGGERGPDWGEGAEFEIASADARVGLRWGF